MENEKKLRVAFLLILGAFFGWICYRIAEPFLNPVLSAIVLVIVFYPLHARLQKYIHGKSLAALVSTLLVLLVIIIPTVALAIAISEELAIIVQNLNAKSAEKGGLSLYIFNLLERLAGWVGRYIDLSGFDFRTELLARLSQASTFLIRQAAGAVGNVISYVVDGVIAFLTLFFLFRDGHGFYRRLAFLTPLRLAQMEKLTSEASRVIIASVYGGLAVAVVQGALTGGAFWILGIQSPILWGVGAAITSFLPLIGSAVIWLPAAIFLIVNGEWIKGLILIGWGAAIVGTADNVIRPYVISGQVKFHPLYVFFSLLGGVQAFGIIGLFVGPVVVAISIAVFRLIREELQSPKEVKSHAG